MLTKSEKLYLSRQIKCRIIEICKRNDIPYIDIEFDNFGKEFETILHELQGTSLKLNDQTFAFNVIKGKEDHYRFTLYYKIERDYNPQMTISGEYFILMLPTNAISLLIRYMNDLSTSKNLNLLVKYMDKIVENKS